MFTVVVSVHDATLRRRIEKALIDISVAHRLADRAPVSGGAETVVHCLSASTTTNVANLPCPAVLVTQSWGSHPVSPRVLPAGVAALDISELTPATLLNALMLVTMRVNSNVVALELGALRMFRHLPAELIAGFLEHPAGFVRSRDIRMRLNLSRRAVREFVTGSRLKRGEHLMTALRSATLILLMSHGLARPAIEQYLGIADRPTFRRSCRRAGVPVPHRLADVRQFSA